MVITYNTSYVLGSRYLRNRLYATRVHANIQLIKYVIL